ncbi:MAG: hypothetical protein HY394_05990 [Candidatus Diapherotrites archaeon]|nr:hypothetical protein [Candidatus Diapherotrites archaeon]
MTKEPGRRVKHLPSTQLNAELGRTAQTLRELSEDPFQGNGTIVAENLRALAELWAEYNARNHVVRIRNPELEAMVINTVGEVLGTYRNTRQLIALENTWGIRFGTHSDMARATEQAQNHGAAPRKSWRERLKRVAGKILPHRNLGK